MDDGIPDHLPPLKGCLYCHAEGTTFLTQGRKMLGLGGDFPVLKCDRCHAVAQLDIDPAYPDEWNIRYRRTDRSPRYYYVYHHLGKAGWLSAEEALVASTNGYAQRARVAQTKAGDLSWLRPGSLRPPPPMMSPVERVYLTLRAVTLQETPPPGFLVRADQGAVLDSGKLYVTDQKLHLLGQRRDWTHDLNTVRRVSYNGKSWTVFLDGEARHYRGINVEEQYDAQLIATVIEALCRAEDEYDW